MHMRRLTDNDLTNIAGSTIHGYHVEGVRIKRGPYTDSDHYGIILGRNSKGHFVTWEFHFDEDDTISTYLGHYFMENKEVAIHDFNTRGLDGVPKLSNEYWDCECKEKYIHPNSMDICPVCGAVRDEMPDSRQDEVDQGTHIYSESPKMLQEFKVTITEKLQKVVIVDAGSNEEAERIVYDRWRNSEYILTSEDFVDVGFLAIPADD